VTPDTGPASSGEAEILRPEARPLPYAQLDEQQQAALERVIGLFATAVQAAPGPAPGRVRAVQALQAPSGPYLESARSSRNILIGGERGTGKTTLMLSLASVFAAERDTEPDKSLPDGVADQARALRRRLVWLETLDMEPLASEANLLGAVLARLEDAVGARFPGMDDATETVSMLHPGTGFHDMSRELHRLQTSVALTFGGNLGKRGGSLDPDTFAIESRRAERERLGLDRRFASVLAGLSSAIASTVELTEPVFVLPVDDVDLNVGDCVPLLRLLRAISSPHLVVVLAADVGLLSTIMRLSYQRDLGRISTPVSLGQNDLSVASDLAANALRKHLPPAQRVVLGLVDPGRALAFRPFESAPHSLGQLLGRIELRADSATLQVAKDFGLTLSDAMHGVVTTPGWSAGTQDNPAELAERLAPFSWPQVLHLPLRQLIDLYLECTMRAEGQRQHHPPARPVTDSPLARFVRERLQALRERTQGSGPNQPTESFGVSPWLGTPAVTQPGEAPAVRSLPWHGWQAYAGSGPLVAAEAAVLVGCVDLLGDRWGIPFAPPPAALLGPVRATQWPAYAADHERWIDWPWVAHSAYWAYERALAWLAKAGKAWTDQNQPDAAFGSWVAVMTAQLFDAPGADQPFDQPTRPLARDWNELAGRLRDLPRTPLAEAWLDAAGLLCTPEMGMTSPVPAFLPDWRAERVQALRAERAPGLPPSLQELVESPVQAAKRALAQTVGSAPSRARAARAAPRAEARDRP
jgi:hypothetical protein